MIRQLGVVVLTVFATAAVASDRHYVAATAVNLREQPAISAKIVAAIPIATEVEVQQSDDLWVQVVVQNGEQRGKRGWMAREFLTEEYPSVEAMLELADRTTLDYKIRLQWIERAAALERIRAEELRKHAIGQKETDHRYPFVDFNGVKKDGISGSDSGIVFQTTGGIKNFDPSTGMWTYGVSPEARFSMQPEQVRPWETLSAGFVRLPSWYKQEAYVSVLFTDNSTDPSWILTSQAGESAVCAWNDVVDVKRRIIYRLPCGHSSLFVKGRVAWLGSTLGVSALNFDTLERTGYVTLPETRWLVDALSYDDTIYYASSIAGVFSIDRKSGAVRQLDVPGKDRSQARGVVDIALHDRQLYCLHPNGHLSIYDLVSSKVVNIDTGVRFANRLVVENGVAYGYGRMEEWAEGAERIGVRGGAFEYRIKDGTYRVLLSEPVSYLRMKGDVAISIDEGFGDTSDIYHGLRGVHVAYKQLLVSSYTRTSSGFEVAEPALQNPIFEVQGKFYSAVQQGVAEGRRPAPRFEFEELKQSDPAFETAKLILEMREFEKSRSQSREARIKKTFSDLTVRPQTIAIPASKAEVLRPTE